MAQEQKKVLDAKSGDRSFIPGINMVEGESLFLQTDFWLPQ